MFLDELTPFVQELGRNPVAFLGGFVAGALRLNLSEDPVKGWLDQQMGMAGTTAVGGPANRNGTGKGPQTISID